MWQMPVPVWMQGTLAFSHAGPDQAGAAPGDQQVHIAHGGHQLVGRGVGGVLDQVDGGHRQAGAGHAPAQGLHNGPAGAPGLLAAAQNADVAAFQGQGSGVAGDVGAALVDDGDDAHGYGGLFDHKAVGPLDPAQHRAHRVGQGGHLPDALGHPCQPRLIQGQTVQHHVRDMPPANGLVIEKTAPLPMRRPSPSHPTRARPSSQRRRCLALKSGNVWRSCAAVRSLALQPGIVAGPFICAGAWPESGCLRAGPRRFDTAVRGGRRWRSPFPPRRR